MFWNLQPGYAIAFAIGITVLAVVLYGFASRLPLPFPAIMRLVCVWLLVTSTTLLVMVDETLWQAIALGGGGVAAIVIIHLAQTRRKNRPVDKTVAGD